ncbi:MAG: SDR family NAD(P)-dependent oxidoreductase [Actinomycetes bacterium]|jgi:NAD(P)-dependent dehydrogenase (short-subunit alcohol dehydrogenase family)
MTSKRLAGKSALITGGASGVGRATAIRFADEGAAHIGLYDLNPENLANVAQEIRDRGSSPLTFQADVTSREQCQAAVDAVVATAGRLDILVANAAVDGSATFLEMTEDEWHRVINVNLTSSFILGQMAARAMVADDKGGCILYTASISGMGASEGDVHYGVSKAGVINLVQTMALELVKQKVRVNCVSPGPLDTPLSRALLGSDEAMERAREHFPLVPMGRLGLPEEIAAAYAYLASSDGAFTTGQNLVIDGGMSASVFLSPEGLFDE